MDVGSLRAGSSSPKSRAWATKSKAIRRKGGWWRGAKKVLRCSIGCARRSAPKPARRLGCHVKFAYGIREREIVFWSWRSRLMKNFCIELLTKSLYDRTFDYMNRYQRLPSGVRLEEANGLEILNCFHSCSLCKLGNDQPCSYFWAIKFLFFCPVFTR